jgi:hypothetical protein
VSKRNRGAKGGSPPKRELPTKVREPPHTPDRLLVHHTPMYVFRWWIGLPVAVLGVLAGIDQVFGPPWPTAPIFDPGTPSFSSPLSVPFYVKNGSILFPVTNLTIICHIIHVDTSDKGTLDNINIFVAARRTLAAPETKRYICPIKVSYSSGLRITSAKIQFISSYDDPLFLPFHVPKLTKSDLFTLDNDTAPPQWLRGDSL